MDRCRVMARMLYGKVTLALGSAVLNGDPVALLALHDALAEIERDHGMRLNVGDCWHVQTVTHYWVGRVVKCDLEEIVMREASCVFSVGPLADAFQQGTLRRFESYPPEDEVHISQGAVVAANPWRHPLPQAASGVAS